MGELRRLQHDEIRGERIHGGAPSGGRQQHVRVGVLEPGGVATELAPTTAAPCAMTSTPPTRSTVRRSQPEDIANGVAYMVTRPRRSSVAELWIMPTSQA